jgi:hypothetical protein
MRILFVNNPNGLGAFQYITQGLINALIVSGHIVQRWDGTLNSWNNFDPDMYCGASGHRQQIPTITNRKKTIIGIHVNPWGNKKIGSVDNGPIIDEPQEAVSWTINQKPNFVYCYCSDTFTDDYFTNYKKNGIKVIGLPAAADTTIYQPTNVINEYNCDIGWVGGYWPYKAKMMDKYLLPLFNKYNCRIYGWGNTWKNNKKINDNDLPKLFSSAKICPSISESHSVTSPIDIPERVFKIPASGGFTIHTPSPAIKDMFGDNIPMANNTNEWFEMIKHYINNHSEREKMKIKERNIILSKHTYFDRMISISKAINNSQLEESLTKTKTKFN